MGTMGKVDRLGRSHGINMPLAMTGTEYVYMKTFESFGLSNDTIINDYFAGILFLPWNRLGNIKKFGNPISMDFINEQVTLQKQILDRYRSFGMTPVLPGFNGFVPDEFVKLFPSSKFTKSSKWNHFTSNYSALTFLDPIDPLFVKIGTKFLEIQTELFGTDHLYCVDSFNENKPHSGSIEYLKSASKGTYDALSTFDPDAIWLMQGWPFFNEFLFWMPWRIEAYLSSVPNDKMIVLDLYSEAFPVWRWTKSYHGKPFIWCYINNFGGRRGLFGNINNLGEYVPRDFHDEFAKNLVGIGITSEAIYTPPYTFEFFLDLQYSIDHPLGEQEIWDWTSQYVNGRYAGFPSLMQQSWKELTKPDGVYNFDVDPWQFNELLNVVTQYPTLDILSITNTDYYVSVSQSYRLFHQSFLTEYTVRNDGLEYDYVDLGRQYLSNLLNDVYNMIYQRTSSEHQFSVSFPHLSSFFLNITSDLDRLLGTTDHFLLGEWIESARSWGENLDQQNLYEMNARNLITLWGPVNQGVGGDYAEKSWNGMLGDYYLKRWTIFFENLENLKEFDESQYRKEQDEFEVFWQTDFKTKFLTKGSGDLVQVGKEIFSKYAEMPGNYDVKKDTDTRLFSMENLGDRIYNADVTVMAILCNIDPLCVGFSSDGFLKAEVERTEKRDGVDLYVKKK